MWILLFSVVALFEYNVSTILSLSHCLKDDKLTHQLNHLLIEGETDWLTD